jgi:hypothetical protein
MNDFPTILTPIGKNSRQKHAFSSGKSPPHVAITIPPTPRNPRKTPLHIMEKFRFPEKTRALRPAATTVRARSAGETSAPNSPPVPWIPGMGRCMVVNKTDCDCQRKGLRVVFLQRTPRLEPEF